MANSPGMKSLTCLLAASVAFSALACGGSTVAGITKKQSDAVTAAKIKSCDRYQACGEIGSGKTYTDNTSCEADQTDTFNGRWPVADCDNKISKSALQICLDAIVSTSCTNFIDQYNTAVNKCNKNTVCSG